MSLVRRLFAAVVLVLTGCGLVASRNTGASMNPPPVPLMVVGVSGTRTVYVVSTSNIFDSKHPAACGIGCYLLKRTTDGGTHFSYRDLPRTTYTSDSLTGTLDQLVFANAHDGYALMGSAVPTRLYVTRDGAGTWTRKVIASGTTILAFAATRTELYAVVANCSRSMACSDLRFARSSLSGANWTVSPLPRWPAHMGVGMGAFGSTVWLTQQSRKYNVLLLTSHDSGAHFSQAVAPDLGSVYACHVTATSAASLWAECPTGMLVSFYYSGNGGVTWNHLPSRQFAGTGGGYFDPVSSSLAYLVFGLANASGPRNLYRVTNKGLTMTAVGKLKCASVNDLVYTDALHGFAACFQHDTWASSVLLRTSDGGITWGRVNSFYNPF